MIYSNQRKEINRQFENKEKLSTVCPRSLNPFYIVSHCIKWVKTSRIYSIGARLPTEKKTVV